MSLSHTTPILSNPAVLTGDPDISDLLQMLGRLTDPRSSQGKRHHLVFALASAVVAVLAGASSYRQIASQVADLPQALLAKLSARWNWFAGRYQAPSEPTLRRVLQTIDAAELDQLVGAWLFDRAHRHTDGRLAIALDGKVLRGAWTDDNDQVTLFSAMLHSQGVTIAQRQVPDNTNEITQVRPLLEDVEIDTGTPVIVTIDAAHTQRDTAEYLKGTRGFDYVMTVKGNQPSLQNQVLDKCRTLVEDEPEHVVEERGHGRINRWSTWTTNATGIDFPHSRQLACIRRDVFDLDRTQLSKEFALVITSSPAHQTGPADLHTHTRNHWGIENKSHYVRDTTWQEDHNQAHVGNGPHAMAVLRNLAIGLFRLNGVHRIKQATEEICRNRNRALHLLAT